MKMIAKRSAQLVLSSLSEIFFLILHGSPQVKRQSTTTMFRCNCDSSGSRLEISCPETQHIRQRGSSHRNQSSQAESTQQRKQAAPATMLKRKHDESMDDGGDPENASTTSNGQSESDDSNCSSGSTDALAPEGLSLFLLARV